jgi:hypothetical protein
MRNLQEVHWTGNREANCHMYCWATKTQRLDLVEGSTPSKMKETAHTGGTGNVVAATPPLLGEVIERTLSGVAQDERT